MKAKDPSFSYWFDPSSAEAIDINNYLHSIEDYEAQEIVERESSKQIVILQQKEHNTIQLTYLHEHKLQKKILIIPSDNAGCVIEETSAGNKQYTGIQDAIQRIVGKDAIIFKNLNYVDSTLKAHKENPLSDLTINEILDISATYATFVCDQSKEAENLRAECFFYRFRQQLPKLENLSPLLLQQYILAFQGILEDELETDIIRSKCYVNLAKLIQELPETIRLDLTMMHWYVLYLAKMYTSVQNKEYSSLMNEYLAICYKLSGEESSQKSLQYLPSLSGYKALTQNISQFLFRRFIADWRQEDSEINEVQNIIRVISDLIYHAPILKEFNLVPISQLEKITAIFKSPNNFLTTNQIFNCIDSNFFDKTLEQSLLVDVLNFIKKNSKFLKIEVIINFTEFDDTALKNKKSRYHYPLLFTPMQDNDEKLHQAFSEFKPQKVTIDVHGGGNLITLKNGKKSPDDTAIYLASYLKKAPLSTDSFTINLISCYGAGSIKKISGPKIVLLINFVKN